jgi:hypothetical protein
VAVEMSSSTSYQLSKIPQITKGADSGATNIEVLEPARVFWKMYTGRMERYTDLDTTNFRNFTAR